MFILEKLETMESISEGWESTQDYILSTVFYKPTSVDPVTGKLVADITNIEGEVRFERNEFPYQLDEGGHHYVLWLGPTAAGGLPTEDEINTHITIALRAYTRENRPRSTADDRRNNDSFDFAWYENPNMTVPLVYHVQVFWQYLAK